MKVLKDDLKPINAESKIQQLDSITMSKKENLQLRQQLKVCDVFCRFNDQVLYTAGGFESSAVHPGEVKIMQPTVLAQTFPKHDVHTNKNLKESL